jgi:hypothetical protein
MRRFWPVGEAAQADYEALRERVLEGSRLVDLAAVRFHRLGLAALIASPASAPIWQAQLFGARRPRWSPHDDPRVHALVAGYAWVLAVEPERLVGLKESEVR